MDSLVEQMKLECEVFQKSQEEQKVIRERRMKVAALRIQTSFRGYWYDSFSCCYLLICILNLLYFLSELMFWFEFILLN